jgi:photosystem II stability/assembly factor-like uncharacterized protein
MKKLVILSAILGLFFLSNLAFVQQNYSKNASHLIKIDIKTQQDIDKIKGTDIKVYAKTQDFFVAEANEENLNWFKTSGISYKILDEELEVYDYYLVYPRPGQNISSQLQQIKAKSSVLVSEDNVALIRGNPRKIQELTSEGFGLKKIQMTALPLEDDIFTKSYLQSLSPAYDPLIDSIIHKVNQTQALSWIDDLSGENPVIIGGFEDVIRTRYSLSPGVFKAAHYLKERFEEMGISAEFDTFRTAGFSVELINVAASPDGQKAWATNYWGGIVKTTDGGNSWDSIPGTENFPLWGIDRVTDDILWAVGDFGTIVRSIDGSNTWEDMTIDTLIDYNFRGCYFENKDTGWVVGDYGILYTENGGSSWALQKSSIYRLYGIDFIDQNEGWVAGSGGTNATIFHTINRGTNWNSQTSGTNYSLRDVQFLSSLKGWVCGASGMVRFTTNGGTSWTQKNLGSSTTLNGLCFTDTLKGWIVGFDGSIYYTADGGTNWGAQQSNTSYLYGVDFSDSLTGWAVGYEEIIKTTDGGENWFSQYGNLEPTELVNVVGTIPGKGNPGRQCLITGHYDNTSEDPYNYAPGADDNASGTQTILAAASILKDYNLNNTVKFIGFSGEEQGLLGSAAYAQKADDRNDTILGVLNFDMIAWDGNKDNVMEVQCGSPSQNQALANIFIGVIADYGIPLTPQKIISGTSGGSDHASFWDHNFPAILGIEDFQDFNTHYHTTGDQISAFDTSYFVDFTKGAVGSMAILAEPYLVGDADKNRKIELADVIVIANYILKSGTSPNPIISGDVDCDGNLDLADVIYLANYLLKSGPDLCPP